MITSTRIAVAEKHLTLPRHRHELRHTGGKVVDVDDIRPRRYHIEEYGGGVAVDVQFGECLSECVKSTSSLSIQHILPVEIGDDQGTGHFSYPYATKLIVLSSGDVLMYAILLSRSTRH